MRKSFWNKQFAGDTKLFSGEKVDVEEWDIMGTKL